MREMRIEAEKEFSSMRETYSQVWKINNDASFILNHLFISSYFKCQMLVEKNLESSESCKQQKSLNAQLKDMQTLHLEDMSKADAMHTSLVEEITKE